MKIRNGFVSNSSSSSFVIHGDVTTAQIAGEMMYVMREERLTSYAGFEWNTPQSFHDAIEWLHDNVEFDDPILLPWSVNEETFIWKESDRVCIKTCNNHDWSMLDCDHDSEHIDYFYEGVCNREFLDLEDMNTKTQDQFLEEQRKKWEAYRNENS